MSARRRRGAGTISEHDGKWRFRCPDGAGGRYVSPTEYDSPEKALAALAVFRKMVASRELVAIQGLTLTEFFDRVFLPQTERLRRAGTVAMYESKWSRIGKAAFARKPMASVTRKEIREWVERLPLTRPDCVLAVVRAVFQVAVEKDYLATNPASDIRVEMPERDEDELRPTVEEQERLFACAAIPAPEKLVIMFATGAGLRPGEWRNLEIADVHLDEPTPWVFVQYGTDWHGKTKTGKKRRVPLLGMAARALTAWLEQLPTYAPDNPLELVFPMRSGARRDASSPFGRRGKKRIALWPEWLAAAKIERRLTPHSLRHGCATDLLTGARGVRLEAWQVQILLGHGRITTTLRYMHPSEHDLFAAVARQDTVRTGAPQPKSETAAKQAVPAKKEGLAEETGFEPLSPPRLALVGHPQTESAPPCPDSVLISDAREALARMHAGGLPSGDMRQALAARAREARQAAFEAGDRVMRAAMRVEAGGRHELAAFVELLDALVPDAPATRSGEGSGT